MKFQYDKSWTLFLDRDGVINEKIENDYVRNISQFKLIPGVLDAFKIFKNIFGRIIIVTNQQGINKKLMTSSDGEMIHHYLIQKLVDAGCNVDAILFAPNLKEENHPDRKPGIGMANKAKGLFPEIDFAKSVIAGDSKSDMLFGANARMIKIFISSNPDTSVPFDKSFNSLIDYAMDLKNTVPLH
ncbi:MAG: HAD-IIIA family hydrolase [Ignavibacteria bacterium]|nr:HAD-IIIA family hydrolase [Ignavibacteria bacterium]